MGGKRHGGQKTGGQKAGGQKAWGAKGWEAKGRGAKDRGAKDRGAKDRGAKVLEPLIWPIKQPFFQTFPYFSKIEPTKEKKSAHRGPIY